MFYIQLFAVVILLPFSDVSFGNANVWSFMASMQMKNQHDMRNTMSRGAIGMSNTLHKRFGYKFKEAEEQLPQQDVNYIINPWELFNTLLVTMSLIPYTEDKQTYEFKVTEEDRIDMLFALTEFLYHLNQGFSSDPLPKIFTYNTLFVRGSHTMDTAFLRNTKDSFQSAFYDVTNKNDDEILEEMRNSVVNKSRHMFTNVDYINDTNFMVAVVASTYLHVRWMYQLTPSWEWFYCINDKKQYKMRMTKSYFRGFYIDESDRFAVIVPMSIRGALGILFYVPKSHELFKTLDKNMNYSLLVEMHGRLRKMKPIRLQVIYPIFNTSFSSEIKMDMMQEVLKNIFTGDDVSVPDMTDQIHMYVKNVHHQCAITMNDKTIQFASNTYLAFSQYMHNPTTEPYTTTPDPDFICETFTEQTTTEKPDEQENPIVPYLEKELRYNFYFDRSSGVCNSSLESRKSLQNTNEKVQNSFTNGKKQKTSRQRKNPFIMRNPGMISPTDVRPALPLRGVRPALPLRGVRPALPLRRYNKFRLSSTATKSHSRKYLRSGIYKPKVKTTPFVPIRNLQTNNMKLFGVRVNTQTRNKLNSRRRDRFRIPTGKQNIRISNKPSNRKSSGIQQKISTTFKNKCSLNRTYGNQGHKKMVRVGENSFKQNQKAAEKLKWGNKTPKFQASIHLSDAKYTNRNMATSNFQPVMKVVINSSFFYGIINLNDDVFYSLGKVFHCPDVIFDEID